MNIKWPQPGKYVVAVSGGVDSVALLDLLSQTGKYDLVVAHYNHNLRPDSNIDECLVRDLAARYGHSFHTDSWDTPLTGEDAARRKRYEFLRDVMGHTGADGIITGHHKDDLIETVYLNLFRGTGRTGLTPFGGDIIRPLTGVSKPNMYKYAQDNNLSWREDSTNQDTTLTRNNARLNDLPAARSCAKDFDAELDTILQSAATLNASIDAELNSILPPITDRCLICAADDLRDRPYATVAEIIRAAALKLDPAAEINRGSLEQAAGAVKRSKPGHFTLTNALFANVENDTVTIAFLP